MNEAMIQTVRVPRCPGCGVALFTRRDMEIRTSRELGEVPGVLREQRVRCRRCGKHFTLWQEPAPPGA